MMETEFAVETYASDGWPVVFVVHRPTQTVIASDLSYAEARRLRQSLLDHPDVATALLALHRDGPTPTEDPPEKGASDAL